jgi:hypothetical protein
MEIIVWKDLKLIFKLLEEEMLKKLLLSHYKPEYANLNANKTIYLIECFILNIKYM